METAMARAENKSTPRVESGYLYTDAESFALDSDAWQSWLISHRSFYFQSPIGTFTARKELRKVSWYWYAYRKHASKLHKCYIGQSHELTAQRLADIAQRLAEQIEQSDIAV
jgi:hypothetical protein